jgi:hypothetical protein
VPFLCCEANVELLHDDVIAAGAEGEASVTVAEPLRERTVELCDALRALGISRDVAWRESWREVRAYYLTVEMSESGEAEGWHTFKDKVVRAWREDPDGARKELDGMFGDERGWLTLGEVLSRSTGRVDGAVARGTANPPARARERRAARSSSSSGRSDPDPDPEPDADRARPRAGLLARAGGRAR